MAFSGDRYGISIHVPALRSQAEASGLQNVPIFIIGSGGSCLWQPARVVGAVVVKATGEQARVAAIWIDCADGRRSAGLGPAENDVPAVRRFAGAKIPDRRVTLREARDSAVQRVEAADLRAAPGKVRLEITIEVIGVGTLRLEFPSDL